MIPTRPMLCATVTHAELDRLRFPVLASPKLDGIRCLVHPTLGPVSRTFKPIPNDHIREWLSAEVYHGLDGELVTLDSSGMPKQYNQIYSDVMSQHGTPNFMLMAFDQFTIDAPFGTRLDHVCSTWIGQTQYLHRAVAPLGHRLVDTVLELMEYKVECLNAGYEGIVFRDPQGPYKSGRSTLRQQWMVKYKEFLDAEGTITGFEELYRNENEQERDAFGLTDRSTRAEGLRAGGTLGALVLRTTWGETRVGTGFDSATRDAIWLHRDQCLGRKVTFKYQREGMADLPRFPVFLRFTEGIPWEEPK